MKKILIAASIVAFAGAASAGGLSDPIVTPAVVMDEAIASAGGDEWVGVLMTFLTIILLGVGS